VGEFPHIFFGLMGTDSLLEAVRRHVADLGFELIEFKRSGPPPRPSLQVRIDRRDSRPGHGVTAGDCARVSRSLERWLEGGDVIGPRYLLQVSSPGIERPVRFPEHWRRYLGRTVKLTARSLAGHPRAVILEVPDEAHVRLRLPDGVEVVIELAEVKDALLEDAADSAATGRRDP
jgi:ribosome maturation factor RimP